MYDDEEEIKRKRRNLIIIICIIACIIVFLLIFLIAYKPPEPQQKLLCKLVAEREPDDNGLYNSPVSVSIEATPSTGAAITEKNVGLKQNDPNNIDTYKIVSDGKTTLVGYVKDSKGKEATCTMTIIYNATKPKCTLEVKDGKLGGDSWYLSNITIGFKEKVGSIEAFGLGTKENYDGNDTFIVENDGITEVFGYIKDEFGEKASCSLKVKRDTEKPNCNLKVVSGQIGTNGKYNGEVVVGFENNNDATSTLKSFDVTSSGEPSYNNNGEFKITQNGNYNVYGYVRDVAGNTNSCTLNVVREDSEPQQGGGDPGTGSAPTCKLSATGGQNNGYFRTDVTIKMTERNASGGATIEAFGVGTSKGYNGKDSIVISKDGKYNIYGYVKDSNGREGQCSVSFKRDTTPPTCSLKASNCTYDKNEKACVSNNLDITVTWASANDNLSGIRNYAIGYNQYNANNNSYKVTNYEKATVKAIIQDKAGNTGRCEIEVFKKR